MTVSYLDDDCVWPTCAFEVEIFIDNDSECGMKCVCIEPAARELELALMMI